MLFASTLQLERDQQTLDASLTLPRDGDGYRDIAGVKWRTARCSNCCCARKPSTPAACARGDDEHGYGLTFFTRERSTPMAATPAAPRRWWLATTGPAAGWTACLTAARAYAGCATGGASRYAGSDTDFLRAYARAIGFIRWTNKHE